MGESHKFHPALSITNVKSLVPIELDNKQSMYHSWAALFTNLARVHDLSDHIIPPTEETAKAAYEKAKTADLALWRRLDAAVLQWIYGTISHDLLGAVLKRNDTAEAAWNRLEAMFQDNKASRATHLEEDFTNADFEVYKSIDLYCNYLQSLADRLADVNALVSNNRLVLRLTGSLPEAFSGTVDFIQNQEPLPSFESCRSRLKMAERTINARTAREAGGSGLRGGAAMVAASSDDASSAPKRPNNNKGRNTNKKKGKPGQQGGSPVGQPGQTYSQQPSQQPRPPQWSTWQPGWGGWAIPPCPFPSYSWQPRPNYPAQRPAAAGPGVLGPRPQAYNAIGPQYGSYAPTDIEAAMHALSFTQPDGNYYMDTGATSHMTADADGNQTNEM